MHICLIFDNPETPQHPVIGLALEQLRQRHAVRLQDVRALTAAQALAQEEGNEIADLYLLKSHAPQALELARVLEERGGLVLNSWAATLACQDRALMAERMTEAHLPWPRTWSFATLAGLLQQPEVLATFSFPLIIKSAYSHRGDLVQKVDAVEDMQALAAHWSQEPIIVQAFAAGDGWDTKLWVIDQHLFAARRRTALDSNAPQGDLPVEAAELPSEWVQITLEIGRVFGLRLYGLDLLLTERGPVVVDVNAFPGFRGAAGAADALVGLVERLGEERTR
jgi:ribosomal protein S6--L-glutamate ligase